MDAASNTSSKDYGGASAAGRYSSLSAKRTPFLDRARECSRLTIPTLMPPSGTTASSKLQTPFQGLGARGVNNLAAKLLLALFPPNAPFFRMSLDEATLEKVVNAPGMKQQVDIALAKIERIAMAKIETEALRVPAFEAIKQLINSGNALCYLPPGQPGMRVYRLDRFVVLRDPIGNVLEIITEDPIAPAALSDDVRKLISDEHSKDPHKTVNLYTWVRREVTKNKAEWVVHQEIGDKLIPGTRGTFPIDKCPWIPLRWSQLDGEDYGRSYVDEYFGDLSSLESLTQAIVEGSAAAAKVLLMVNPNGTTRIKDVAKSPNLSVVSGNGADVTVLQLQKFNDFRVALETSGIIQQRLSFAFLLNTAIQRPGERVTAEEIRYMAGELEDALGGVYSILSQEFQLPLIRVILDTLERAGKLPTMPKGMVRPTITTGLEALGRGHDLNRLNAFLQQLTPLGPETIATYLNISNYISRVGTSLNIDMDGLVRSQQEVDAQMQQAQLMQQMQQLGPKGMDILRDQMDPQTGSIDAAQAVEAVAGLAGGQ